jgi:hypothetical protein
MRFQNLTDDKYQRQDAERMEEGEEMALEPIDEKQCQAEKPSGDSFLTFGPRRPRIRCSNKPAYIAKEKRKGKDGKRGSMSLCKDCAVVFEKQMGKDYAELTPIKGKALPDFLSLSVGL